MNVRMSGRLHNTVNVRNGILKHYLQSVPVSGSKMDPKLLLNTRSLIEYLCNYMEEFNHLIFKTVPAL